MAIGPNPGKTRRGNFEAYYKANPDKLKGKSIDEAYAAMQRESGRIQSATANSNRHSSERAAAIQRRLKSSNDNPMTMANTNPFAGMPNPLAAGKDGSTPYQRLNKNLSSMNKSLQSAVDKNPLAHMGNPLANKDGQTPIDRLMGRRRSSKPIKGNISRGSIN